MTRVFLDSSVLFAAVASPKGGSGVILDLCQHQRITAVVSRLVLIETGRNIRTKLQPDKLAAYYRLLERTPFAVSSPPMPEVTFPYHRIIAPKDAPILAAAIENRCGYLVTLDRRDFMTPAIQSAKLPIRILTPGDFLQTYAANQAK